jgi:uncharacterized protein (TIGR01655 family)
MKKLIPVLAILALVAGGLYFVYQKSYGGEQYYVVIKDDGLAKQQKDDSGKPFTDYHYALTAVSNKLNHKNVTFTADHNLRKGAYLALTVNKDKGVTSFKEVEKSEIKAEIIKELN